MNAHSMITDLVRKISSAARDSLALELLRQRGAVYIEDLAVDIEEVSDRLTELDIECTGAWGDCAVRAAVERPPAIIIVDERGPDGDSKTGFAYLRDALDRLPREVPAVVHSAFISDLDECHRRAHEHDVEVDDFARKPNTDELILAMKAAIWRSLRDGFEQTVEEILSEAFPRFDQAEVLHEEEGEVMSIDRESGRILMRGDEGDYELVVPTWRLIRARADALHQVVKHTVTSVATQLISDLRKGPTSGEAEAEVEMPPPAEHLDPEFAERLRRQEEDGDNE